MNLRRYLHRFVQSPVRLFASLAIAGSAGLCVAVVGVGLLLSSPATTAIGPPPPDLPAEDVAIVSGAVLRGWFVAGRSGGGAVVLMHGVHAEIGFSMVERARLHHAAGFSLLLFDYQAHGERAGTRITFCHLEAFYAAAAGSAHAHEAPAAWGRDRRESELVAGGRCGSAWSDPAAGRRACSRIGLSGYRRRSTANRIRAVFWERRFGSLVLCRSTRLSKLLPCRPLLVLAAAELRPIDHITDVVAPALIASGTRDTRTTVRSETVAMFERGPRTQKVFWLRSSGAGHVDLESYAARCPPGTCA